MRRFITGGLLLMQIGSAAIAVPPARDAVEKTSDSGDKILCKRFLETGSLVKGKRICKTKTEWQRDRDAVRDLNTTRACAGSDDALCR